MPLPRGNLYRSPAASQTAGETLEDLLAGSAFRLERILSSGHSTPAGDWYDQDQDEWVVLLSGSATLSFADPDEIFVLAPGDWLRIPAHRRHRVERTANDTVWLAIHFDP